MFSRKMAHIKIRLWEHAPTPRNGKLFASLYTKFRKTHTYNQIFNKISNIWFTYISTFQNFECKNTICYGTLVVKMSKNGDVFLFF